MEIDFIQILQDILGKFGAALPGIIGALIVFIGGWIFSGLIAKLIRKTLEKIGIDKFSDSLNKIDLFSKTSIEVKPSQIISKIAYYLLMLVTLMVAAQVSGLQELSDLMEKIIDYTPKLLSAFVMFIVGLILADFVKKMVKTACASVGIPSGRIIADFIFYFLFITVTMTALKQAGVTTDFMTTNLTIIIAGIVIAFAIGYGFASRKIMASVLSSFFYTKGKISIGDVIRIDNVKGRVVEMDGTSITLLTEENNKMLVPLSKFSDQNVEIFNE